MVMLIVTLTTACVILTGAIIQYRNDLKDMCDLYAEQIELNIELCDEIEYLQGVLREHNKNVDIKK